MAVNNKPNIELTATNGEMHQLMRINLHFESEEAFRSAMHRVSLLLVEEWSGLPGEQIQVSSQSLNLSPLDQIG